MQRKGMGFIFNRINALTFSSMRKKNPILLVCSFVVFLSFPIKATSNFQPSQLRTLFNPAAENPSAAVIYSYLFNDSDIGLQVYGEAQGLVENTIDENQLLMELNGIINSNIGVNSINQFETQINNFLRTTQPILRGNANAILAFRKGSNTKKTAVTLSYDDSLLYYQQLRFINGVDVDVPAVTALIAGNTTIDSADFLNAIDTDVGINNTLARIRTFSLGYSHRYTINPIIKFSYGVRFKAQSASISSNLVDFRTVISTTNEVVQLESADIFGNFDTANEHIYGNVDLALTLHGRQYFISIYSLDTIPQRLALPSFSDTCESVNDCAISALYPNGNEFFYIDPKVRFEYSYLSRRKQFRFSFLYDILPWRDGSTAERQLLTIHTEIATTKRNTNRPYWGHPSPSIRLSAFIDDASSFVNDTLIQTGFSAWFIDLNFTFGFRKPGILVSRPSRIENSRTLLRGIQLGVNVDF